MSDEEEMELDELKAKIDKAAEEQRQAAIAVEEPPTPPPAPEPQAPERVEPKEAPVAQSESPKEDKDDPVKWAESKGFKTSEDLARALLAKEQEFHKRNQAGHPGYKDLGQPQTPPQAPQWQPAPVVPQYQPQYQQPPRIDPRQIAAYYPQLAPEDVERVLPLVIDAAQAISARERAEVERRFATIERTTQRNNEMMSLMQDPAFKDPKVQKEIHEILDSDPSIFQRERLPLTYAYDRALGNLYRKQLQQGVSEERITTKPPVTAGGGNGSANTVPYKPTEQEIARWDEKDIKAYINSNGRVLPKR